MGLGVHEKFGVEEIERLFIPATRRGGDPRLGLLGFAAAFRLRCHESDFLPRTGKLRFFETLDGIA